MRLPPRTTRVLQGDNGPEHPRRRPPCMQRMVACVPPYQVTGRLVSAPPSQRTSTPLERCWGLVATHRHGALREAIATGLQGAASMPWQGTPPLVPRVTPPYPTGVTWTTEAMEAVEANLKRLPHLPKWFVDIVPASPPLWAPELFLSPLEEFTASPSSFVSHEICMSEYNLGREESTTYFLAFLACPLCAPCACCTCGARAHRAA